MYMVGFLELRPLQSRHASLLLGGVHRLQFLGCELLYMASNELEALVVISHVGSLPLQANHVQSRCRFERSMYVKVLSGSLGLVQISGQATIQIGLRSQKVSIYTRQLLKVPTRKFSHL